MIWDEPPKRPTEEDLARFCKKIDDDIKRVGWSAIGVMDDPPFTYTVGLTESFDHPELIIYGVGSENAHMILANMMYHIKEDDLVYEPGQKYDEVLVGYEVMVVEHPAYPLNVTGSYYRAMGKEWTALQVVWPDREGKFPGEEGMDPDFEKTQEQKVEDDQT